MKKLKNKINEAQIYISDPKELPQIKSQLNKDDKLFITGDDMNENIEDGQDPMFVEYVSDIKDESPFNIGETKWQYVKARYPNNEIDIGVYRFGHDLVYGYEWFKYNIINQTKNGSQNFELDNTKSTIGEEDNGIEGRDIIKLKKDVKILLEKLNFSSIQNALEKINTPVEKFEVICQFAEMIGIPRHKLSQLISNLRGYSKKVTESNNPKMSKGALLEHIKNIKNVNTNKK